MNSAHRRNMSGFTLLKLLIVVAIIAILALLIFMAAIKGKCRAEAGQIAASIKTCEIALSGGKVDDAVACLNKAQNLIDKLNQSCLEEYRSQIETAVKSINSKVGELKDQTSVDDADKQKLEKAKLTVPAKRT